MLYWELFSIYIYPGWGDLSPHDLNSVRAIFHHIEEEDQRLAYDHFFRERGNWLIFFRYIKKKSSITTNKLNIIWVTMKYRCSSCLILTHTIFKIWNVNIKHGEILIVRKLGQNYLHQYFLFIVITYSGYHF